MINTPQGKALNKEKLKRELLKRAASEKGKGAKPFLVLVLAAAVLLVFVFLYLNQRATVGQAVFIGGTPWSGGEINLTKEGSVTFTTLPSTSQRMVIRTGIHLADTDAKNYTFNLTNKGAQLYGYELTYLGESIAQDVLYVGGQQDSSVVHLNLNDTIPDLRIVYAAGKITIQNLHAVPVSVCGNGIIEGSEQCEGSNLAGKTCESLGFASGTLSCTPGCTFNTAACVPVQPVYQCTGTPPSNSQLCVGDDISLSFNTPLKAISQCSDALKCEYQCNPGYIPNAQGNDCETAPVRPTPVSVVTGIKVSLGELSPANSTFSTLVTATDGFPQKVTVYTVLYDANGKVLKLESDEITEGMNKDEFFVVTATYTQAEVKKKSVLIFDQEQNPAVFGKLEETYS